MKSLWEILPIYLVNYLLGIKFTQHHIPTGTNSLHRKKVQLAKKVKKHLLLISILIKELKVKEKDFTWDIVHLLKDIWLLITMKLLIMFENGKCFWPNVQKFSKKLIKSLRNLKQLQNKQMCKESNGTKNIKISVKWTNLNKIETNNMLLKLDKC